MKVILGVEGGATKTTSIVVNSESEILGIESAGPSSLYAVDRREVKENLKLAIEKSVESSGFVLEETLFDVGCFGLAGMDTKQDCEILSRIIKSLNIAKKYVIVGDEVIAYHAVLCNEPGVIVISGTGSIAYGRNSENRELRVGGWDWLVGDEGSGFDIARKGLAAASRAYDERGEDTLLVDIFLEYFHVSDFNDVVLKIYENTEKWAVASLAPLVSKAAEKGDKIAVMILKEAGKELSLAAITVARRLGLESSVTFGCVGGVFKSGKHVWESFKKNVEMKISDATFKRPRFSAVLGAAILGLKNANVPITSKTIMKMEKRFNQFLK